MPEKPASSEYIDAFTARTKALRERKKNPDGTKWTSEQMAKALDIPVERYRKYESRTPMPHELLERFALIADVTVEFLVASPKPADIRTMRYRKRAVDSSKRREKHA